MWQPTFLTDRVRILVFFKKNPSLSDDQFKRYWLEEHSKVIAKFVERRKGLIKYEQMHINQQELARFKQMGVAVIEGYDGVVLWDVESFDKVTEIWSSAEYFSDVVPDEEKFCDRKDAILVRLNIVSIQDRSSEFPIPAVTATSPPLLQEDRARMVCVIKRKKGTTMEEMTKHWLGEHVRVSSLTQLGKEMIKAEQNHLATPNPIVSFGESASDTVLPDWDGITLIDSPSFDTFLYPKDAKALGEDNAKWLDPGKLLMLPVNVATIIDNGTLKA